MAHKRILLSVGDDSGDLHAANLMRAMRELEPGVRFAGFGMAHMAGEGLEPLGEESSQGSAMWLHNLLRLGHFRRRLALCRDYLDRQRVDLVVPVDFGGFNLYLCREAAARGIPVFYYIPPQVWAHGRYRLKKLKKWVTRAGLIYPFEPELYRRHGVEAEYVGHPLFDELERSPPSERVVEGLRRRFGQHLIGIFPGSRRQEVRAHMPVLLETCRRMREAVPQASFALRCTANTRDVAEDLVRRDGAGMEVLDERVQPAELARASRACITKSGTITLEIAGQGTPMVILYRASPLVIFLGYGLSHVPFVGLVNVLAGRMICPERAMVRADSGWVTEQALRLLQDADAYQACRRAILDVLDGFAEPGASARAARSALELT